MSASQEGPQQWRVGAAVDAGAAANAVASVSAAPEARDGQEQDLRTLVLITTETLGRGDETFKFGFGCRARLGVAGGQQGFEAFLGLAGP